MDLENHITDFAGRHGDAVAAKYGMEGLPPVIAPGIQRGNPCNFSPCGV